MTVNVDSQIFDAFHLLQFLIINMKFDCIVNSFLFRMKKMMLALGCSNDMPTSCNIAQHGVQTNATCCTQHVGTACCIHLHGS